MTGRGVEKWQGRAGGTDDDFTQALRALEGGEVVYQRLSAMVEGFHAATVKQGTQGGGVEQGLGVKRGRQGIANGTLILIGGSFSIWMNVTWSRQAGHLEVKRRKHEI